MPDSVRIIIYRKGRDLQKGKGHAAIIAVGRVFEPYGPLPAMRLKEAGG
jgi:hypothetical protein